MTVRVLASVVSRDSRYLVARRPGHKRHGGLWEFPGGKVHDGESDFEAVQRELREELDVDVTAVGPVTYSVRDPGSPFVINFLPVEITGSPKCLEHSELLWAPLDEVMKLALAPSDRRFAQWLQASSDGEQGFE